jgi:hypothetical protein
VDADAKMRAMKIAVRIAIVHVITIKKTQNKKSLFFYIE